MLLRQSTSNWRQARSSLRPTPVFRLPRQSSSSPPSPCRVDPDRAAHLRLAAERPDGFAAGFELKAGGLPERVRERRRLCFGHCEAKGELRLGAGGHQLPAGTEILEGRRVSNAGSFGGLVSAISVSGGPTQAGLVNAPGNTDLHSWNGRTLMGRSQRQTADSFASMLQ